MKTTIIASAQRATGLVSVSRHRAIGRLLGRSGLIGVLILLCLVAALISPQFLKLSNIVNVLRQMALYGVVSIGMTCVVLTAGIDLSVGSIVGIVAVVSTQLLNGGMTPFLALSISLITGGAIGAFNGMGITLGRVPAFIMTLGVMVIGRGLAMTLANGEPISLSDAAVASVSWIGSGFLLTIPIPVWIFAAVALLAMLTLRLPLTGDTFTLWEAMKKPLISLEYTSF
jgi:ribose transport system permease protein